MCAALAKHGVVYIIRWIRTTPEDRLTTANLSGFSKSAGVSLRAAHRSYGALLLMN